MERIIFKAGYHVGETAAEDDGEFLNNCFIKIPIVELLSDHSNNKSIMLGRTGSGKTAILKYINDNNDDVIEIKPKEVSLDFISNSNVIQFFEELGVDLHLFYQLLWKHVFCVEIIKRVYNVKNRDGQNKFFRILEDILEKDQRKKRALEYVRDWQSKFWIGYDERMREITEHLEKDLRASVGGKVSDIALNLEGARSLTRSERREFVQRGKAVVDKIQIRELNEVIDLLAEAMSDKKRKWFLLIDGLDEPWVDQRIQYKLIGSLIECIRTFRRITNLKIIIALRDDLYENIISATKKPGFQSEKYEGIIAKVNWTSIELSNLIDQRVKYLFVRKYNKKKIITLYDIIPAKIRRYDSFNYMRERTLMRPRDIIAFVNEILENVSGKTEIGNRNIRDAEFSYSKKRMLALEQEWSAIHPILGTYLSFLANRKERIKFSDISVRDFVEDMILNIDENIIEPQDAVTELVTDIMKKQTATRYLNLAREWVLCLYKVGAVGVKPGLGNIFLFSHVDGHQLSRAEISSDTTLCVHPMLWRALNITPNV